MRRPHQRRVLSIVQHIERRRVLQPEKAVPQASRYIDGVIHLDEASRGWGVIQEQLSHRIVIIEHFSRPPSVTQLVCGRAKLSWMVEQWWQRRVAHGIRPPLLLVLSGGRPRRAIAQIPELVPGRLPGLWATAPSLFGDMLLVDVKGIEKADGTSVLRLMHASGSLSEARERIEHLLTDTGVWVTIRGNLVEGIMQGTVELSADEREVTYRSVLERGREEGREEGREALLRIAAGVGGEKLVRELDSIEDLGILEARVLEFLR